jgi:Putative zincin peptidase
MIIIPGFLIALVTFPGVIVHEAAHLFFCKLRRVAVFDVCYFRIGNPSGYVIHEIPTDFLSSFLIAVGPFIINSLLCVVFCFPAFVPVRTFGHSDPICYFLIWLGISIGMHAFPSTQDAKVLWNQAKIAAGIFNPLALLSFPLVVVIYVANGLRFFWLDYLYGFALGFLLPEMILNRVL